MNFVGNKKSVVVLANTIAVTLIDKKEKMVANAGLLKTMDFAAPLEEGSKNTLAFNYDKFGAELVKTPEGNITACVLPEAGVSVNINTGYLSSGKYHGICIARAFQLPENTESFELELVGEKYTSEDGFENCYDLGLVEGSVVVAQEEEVANVPETKSSAKSKTEKEEPELA